MSALTRRHWFILAACLAVPAWFSWYQANHLQPMLPKPPEASEPHWKATPAMKDAAARAIQSKGYDCQWVDTIMPYAWGGEGYTVWCNGYRYTFYIENHGGKWSVKSD